MEKTPEAPHIAVEPRSGRAESLIEAVEEAGAVIAPVTEAEALIWADADLPHDLPAVLAQGPNLRWVGLPYAGIEPYAAYLDADHVWTAAKRVYATPVAEHVLTLTLAGLRGLATYTRAKTWAAPEGRNLYDSEVTVLGGGGITTELMRYLEPFGCPVTVVRRSAEPFPGAARTITLAQLPSVLPTTDVLVIALALTPETEGLIDAGLMADLPDHAWIINVGRGGHIVFDDLVEALANEVIGGCALDVTTPEPLPDGHPLWEEPRCIITPHIANTPEMGVPLLAEHVRENVRRFAAGEELDGIIDIEAGY
ncbi:MAG: hydroxyacid dehydrogenase [Actinomycetia bacterium]|nr:hydroxyacid dehydrogenase [Actinomycetes bacterium]